LARESLLREPLVPVVVTAWLGRHFDVPADRQALMPELENDFREELGAMTRQSIAWSVA
jgi:hypothetical protein